MVGGSAETWGALPLAGRIQRLPQHGAHLRLEPSADNDHAVFILIQVQRPARVALGALHGLRLLIDPPPAANDTLDVLGGAGPADGEEPLFGVRSRDTGYDAPRQPRGARAKPVAPAAP